MVLEDSTGDTTSTIVGVAPAVGNDPSALDLVSLAVAEDSDSVDFILEVANLDQENPTPYDGGNVHVEFAHGDTTYRVRFDRDTVSGTPRYWASLWVFDSGRGGFVNQASLDIGVDLGTSTMTVEVPRPWLVDGNGTAPTAGRSLERFRAFSVNADPFFFGQGGFVQVRDNMPDSGFGDDPYAFVLGIKQSGDARLTSDNPSRASNGEAGTFVYGVRLHNLAPDEALFDLSTASVPNNWEITLPASTIRIPGNASREFPILATVPFAHQHGTFESFHLIAQSRADAGSTGRIELGIRYLEVPQPAGHHDQVYLHTREVAQNQGGIRVSTAPATTAFMNTVEDHDRDQNVLVPPGQGQFFQPGQRFFQWNIYLEPGLEMGLDFDVEDAGELSATFSSELGFPASTLSGQLIHETGQVDRDGDLVSVTETVLADLLPSTAQSIGTSTEFSVVVQPTAEADLVPYSQHAALRLRLVLQTDGPHAGTMQVIPQLAEGQMRLPLNEYRDSIEGVFNNLAGLSFRHDSAPERLVNPGETVLFNLTLRNDGAVDDVFSLRVNGTNQGWARILGDQSVFVATGAERRVVVAVSPDPDAADGLEADLIVTAISDAEPTVQDNIRIIAIVDDVLDHRDEAHLLQEIDNALTSEKKSPGAFIVPALLVAWLIRRR